jgi:hypothetical protein
MNGTTLAILEVVGILGILVIVASALDRRSKTKGNLFTAKPSPTMQIIAIFLGLIFGGIFVAELLWSDIIHFLPPVLAVALLGYAFGAEKLIKSIQGKRKPEDNQDSLK